MCIRGRRTRHVRADQSLQRALPSTARAVRASLAAAAASGSVGASLLRSRPCAGAEAPEKGKIEFFNSSL